MKNALEEKHKEARVEECTNLLNDNVLVALECSLKNCGKVRSEEISQKDSDAMPATWQPTCPLVLLTRPIDMLKNWLRKLKSFATAIRS